MKRKVLIAGAGQLGSRYLQGLSKVICPLEISVFDPSAASLTRAEQRWKEVALASEHAVRYFSALSELPSNLDLAIVATTADVRLDVIRNIGRYADIAYWVLEKVLAQSPAEVVELQGLLGGKKMAWVNTPMHLWPLYQNIRQLYPDHTPIAATFEGFRGLACNAIHYIDFVSRWNGAPVELVDASGLRPEWYAAKRAGFYEVDGELAVSFADGSKLRLSSNRESLGYKARIMVGGDEWQLMESEGMAHSTDGRTINGTIAFQSQLTAPLAESIFAGVPCGLPTLEESAQQHIPLLSALLEHWNLNMPNKLKRLPIT